MMLVKTYVAPSKIHGLGLFASKKIPRYKAVWCFDPHFDKMVYREDLKGASPAFLTYLKEYGYLLQKDDAFVIVDGDNGSFMNHSNEPNCNWIGKSGISARDIAKDEELTCDYRRVYPFKGDEK